MVVCLYTTFHHFLTQQHNQRAYRNNIALIHHLKHKTMEPIKSLDEKIYDISLECKALSYSNVNHREVLRQMADKLEQLARAAHLEHNIAMYESSFEG